MRLCHRGNDRKTPARDGKYPTLFTDKDKWIATKPSPGQKGIEAIVEAEDTYHLNLSAEEVIGFLLRLPTKAIAGAVLKARYFDTHDAPEKIKQLAIGLFERLKAEAAIAADID